MAELPRLETSGVFEAGAGGRPRGGAPDSTGPAHAPYDEKRAALEFLHRTAARCEGMDGRSRFYATKDDNILALPSWQARRGGIGRTVFANACLRLELEALKGVGMSKDEAAIVDNVLGKLNRYDATAQDIVKLSGLMKRVTNDGHRRKQAYSDLKLLADQYRKGPHNKTISWSDKNADVVCKDRLWTTSTGRKEAGRWLATRFAPLEKVVAKTSDADGGTALKEFQHLMRELAKGDLKSHQIVDLFEVVERARNPEAYALRTIERLDRMSRAADQDTRLTWSDKAMDFRVRNEWLTTPAGLREAAARLTSALAGLTLGDRTPEEHGDDQAVAHAMQNGEVTPAHLRHLARFLDKQQDPALAAVKELDRLSRMAEAAGPDKSITWRDSSLDFKMTDRTFMTKEGRRQAANRLAQRLEGALLPLCAHDKQLHEFAVDILEQIKLGDCRSDQIVQLESVVHRALSDDDERFALHELNRLSAMAKSVEPHKLVTWNQGDGLVVGGAYTGPISDEKVAALGRRFEKAFLPLFKGDSRLLKDAVVVLDTIKSGKCTGPDITQLKGLVEKALDRQNGPSAAAAPPPRAAVAKTVEPTVDQLAYAWRVASAGNGALKQVEVRM